jgi:phosphoribosyl-ATP pyrophosphohydrolase
MTFKEELKKEVEMDLTNFHKLSLRTRGKTLTDEQWFFNCILGLSEINEVKYETELANLLLEFGDFLYYFVQIIVYIEGENVLHNFVANEDSDLNMPMYDKSQDNIEDPDFMEDIDCIISDIFILEENLKKQIFHKKDKQDDIMFNIADIFNYIVVVVKRCGFTLEQILQANVDKLKASVKVT